MAERAPTISVREWTDVVRRARLGKTTKYVALMLASYADFRDGRRAFPGLPTLAHAAEVDYKTAKKAISELLAAGLIELAQRRSGQPGSYDEYRLVLAEDLLERVEVPSPAQFAKGVERIRLANSRGARMGQHGPRTDPPVQGTADPVPEPQDAQIDSTVRAVPFRQEGVVRAVPFRSYGPSRSAIPPIDQATTTTPHTSADLETAVTGPRARGRDDPDSHPDSMPDRCAHGLTARRRPDGQSTCVLCRRGVAVPPAGELIAFRRPA